MQIFCCFSVCSSCTEFCFNMFVVVAGAASSFFIFLNNPNVSCSKPIDFQQQNFCIKKNVTSILYVADASVFINFSSDFNVKNPTILELRDKQNTIMMTTFCNIFTYKHKHTHTDTHTQYARIFFNRNILRFSQNIFLKGVQYARSVHLHFSIVYKRNC